ncbi:RadC family protein [Luteibacter aegosomatissinici]|uniref:RadC family protein n=1 Tax=Luteibacter aegosomatissinici TaxID=2911539 RepID=UPI001FFB3CCA|nr:DNA repair protein RadC [Luteibacter aegosomatissinici]UPG94277.1 DNA repair protein RadC [Luteibacter aegosomatissinici]
MPNPSPTKHTARDGSSAGSIWSRPIHAWPERDRPRERLLANGPQALSDAELVAVLLGNGSRGVDAVTMGRALLTRAGGVGKLLAGAAEMAHAPGVGPVKRARLIAAIELARRSLSENLAQLPCIEGVEDCFAFLKARLFHMKHEVIGCLFLDVRHRVITFEIVAEGTVHCADLYPRELARACLRHHAVAIIMVHNHPSGDATPSPDDQALTISMRDALALLDIKLLDHIVVGAGTPVSMARLGMV